jgi:hypothetical protein
MLSKFKLSRNALTLSLLCICLALINSIYWQEFTAKIQIYFVSALIIVKLLNLKQMSEITRISSDVHLALLVLGIVGFVYAKSGGPAIFYIANEDTRLNGFYLTTFSNTYTFGFIRPSGIYDEPGALSFVVCFTVALRELFGMGRKMSWALMLLGLITGSLAHLIFLICFLLQVSSSKMVLKYLLYLVFCIGLIFSFDNPIADLVDSFGDRLTIVDGGLKGDNRSELLGNAIKYLSVDSFFWGLEGSCIANTPECDPQKYDRFLGNPLTLLVYTGLLVSLPYYGGLLLMLGLSIYKHDYLMLGAMLLLFQRPYSLSYGYCILILLYLVAYMSVANANKPQRGI